MMPLLKESRTTERHGRRLPVSVNQILIVAQIAISLVLVAAAGLFVRTLSNLQWHDVGFSRQNVLVFKLNAKQTGHRPSELPSFYRGIEDRLAAIPGVISVTEANSPLIGDGAWVGPSFPRASRNRSMLPRVMARSAGGRTHAFCRPTGISSRR